MKIFLKSNTSIVQLQQIGFELYAQGGSNDTIRYVYKKEMRMPLFGGLDVEIDSETKKIDAYYHFKASKTRLGRWFIKWRLKHYTYKYTIKKILKLGIFEIDKDSLTEQEKMCYKKYL